MVNQVKPFVPPRYLTSNLSALLEERKDIRTKLESIPVNTDIAQFFKYQLLDLQNIIETQENIAREIYSDSGTTDADRNKLLILIHVVHLDLQDVKSNASLAADQGIAAAIELRQAKDKMLGNTLEEIEEEEETTNKSSSKSKLEIGVDLKGQCKVSNKIGHCELDSGCEKYRNGGMESDDSQNKNTAATLRQDPLENSIVQLADEDIIVNRIDDIKTELEPPELEKPDVDVKETYEEIIKHSDGHQGSESNQAEVNIHPCDMCSQSFHLKSDLLIHMRTHSEDVAGLKQEVEEEKSGIETFERINGEDSKTSDSDQNAASYDCNVCSKSFPSKFSLRVHMYIHRDKKVPCDKCNKLFIDKSKMRNHQKVHLSDKSFSCDQCDKSFKYKANLDRHRRNHTGDLPFTCETCGKSFPFKSRLSEHQTSHLDIKQMTSLHKKLFSCDLCDKSFHAKHSLQTHINSHTGERPFSCDICNKTFASKPYLKVHMQVHSDKKPYSCEVCRMSFTSKSSLNIHMGVHNSKRSFNCDLCASSFKTRQGQLQHQKLHSNHKKYTCELCGQSFHRKAYLKRHYLFHTREKPYPCDQCEKSFADKSTLIIHSRTHVGDRPFSCKVCQATFVAKSHLKRHCQSQKCGEVDEVSEVW